MVVQIPSRYVVRSGRWGCVMNKEQNYLLNLSLAIGTVGALAQLERLDIAHRAKREAKLQLAMFKEVMQRRANDQ